MNEIEVKDIKIKYGDVLNRSVPLLGLTISWCVKLDNHKEFYQHTLLYGENRKHNHAKRDIETVMSKPEAWDNILLAIETYLHSLFETELAHYTQFSSENHQIQYIQNNHYLFRPEAKNIIYHGTEQFIRCLIRRYSKYLRLGT